MLNELWVVYMTSYALVASKMLTDRGFWNIERKIRGRLWFTNYRSQKCSPVRVFEAQKRKYDGAKVQYCEVIKK